MLVYHGSDSNFDTLKISKALVKRASTFDNEGEGIYFSTDAHIAKEYGKYLYTLEVNDRYLRDFRQYTNCLAYICAISSKVHSELNVDIQKYYNFDILIKNMYCGGIHIYKLAQEMEICLENDNNWYTNTSKTKREQTYRLIRKIVHSTLKCYMFTYNIKETGVIKDVDPSIVRIIKKEKPW